MQVFKNAQGQLLFRSVGLLFDFVFQVKCTIFLLKRGFRVVSGYIWICMCQITPKNIKLVASYPNSQNAWIFKTHIINVFLPKLSILLGQIRFHIECVYVLPENNFEIVCFWIKKYQDKKTNNWRYFLENPAHTNPNITSNLF